MKHNNNLMPSSHARCKCGRPATIGEWKAGIGVGGNYTCPDCTNKNYSSKKTSHHETRNSIYTK